jgi:hypothetical protein
MHFKCQKYELGTENMEAPFEGRQGPERAVPPYMDGWMDGYITAKNCATLQAE